MIDGDSPAVQRVRTLTTRFAQNSFPVLIQGESGVGKELVARALHTRSARAAHRFVPVNCGALPRELVEAQLFGTVTGAFTGARTHPGLVAAAQGGTLFLDEIGELTLAAQVVLLRVLENYEVWPIGAPEPYPVDFRLVTATHRDLEALVRTGDFRADLFHRIAMLGIRVPPLRARAADIPLLAAALAPTLRLTPGAEQALAAYPWPGNVRELRNVLLRAQLDVGEGDLPVGASALCLPEPRVPVADAECPPLRAQIAACVRKACRRHGGNVRATARALDVSPTTVYRYLATSVE